MTSGSVVDGERLRERISAAGLTHADLARQVGVTQPTITRLMTGTPSGSKHLHQIATALSTTPSYLTRETDDPAQGVVAKPSIQSMAAELGIVGLKELDLTLGMGATYLDVPITETTRYFDQDWLRTYTRAAPENLIFAQGIGDSMEPTIRDTDLLLIDCSRKSIDMTDKFWAIAYANCGAVKRLHQRADGGVDMLSDNPLVPTRTAYDGEMHVLGRVVAIVRKM